MIPMVGSQVHCVNVDNECILAWVTKDTPETDLVIPVTVLAPMGAFPEAARRTYINRMDHGQTWHFSVECPKRPSNQV
jgi:hypothetical protein